MRSTRWRPVAAAIAVAVGLLGAAACGEPARSGATKVERAYGGPLNDPAWDQGFQLKLGERFNVGQLGYAGFPVVINRGSRTAVIERVSLVRPSSNVRVIGTYTADHTRRAVGSDDVWPPPKDLIPRYRRAPGTKVPPKSTPRGKYGVQIMVAMRFPKRGVYKIRAFRVDYRVGSEKFRVVVPFPYVICVPFKRKHCPTPTPYDPKRDGR